MTGRVVALHKHLLLLLQAVFCFLDAGSSASSSSSSSFNYVADQATKKQGAKGAFEIEKFHPKLVHCETPSVHLYTKKLGRDDLDIAVETIIQYLDM